MCTPTLRLTHTPHYRRRLTQPLGYMKLPRMKAMSENTLNVGDIAGYMMCELDTATYYSCVKCGDTFRMTVKTHKGGDVQINLTSLCACMEVIQVAIQLKKRLYAND